MQLSIIIVNFNVRYFLEQCLCAVQKAIEEIDAEVWIVDNASSDGSIEYLRNRFHFPIYLSNANNLGFSKANNLALHKARGEFILFLNPDTIIPEDCLLKCLAFMCSHKEAGALGVRMVDGSGKFLPESKRSFPAPYTSLYKLLGLNAVFPKSKVFDRYALGYLDENKTHDVDVLAGAFMMVRQPLLLQLGGFDESFFMYGEDIDLSYRIQQAGYRNYYFADTTIIHFKGESTKKGTLNYVHIFYNAMSIFVKKHYGGNKARMYNRLIHGGIWLRASATVVNNFLKQVWLPAAELAIMMLAFLLAGIATGSLFAKNALAPGHAIELSWPLFASCYLLTGVLAGIYHERYSNIKVISAIAIATAVNLMVFELLPNPVRYAPVILVAAICAATLIIVFRTILHKLKIVKANKAATHRKQIAIAGTASQFGSIHRLLLKSGHLAADIRHLEIDEDPGTRDLAKLAHGVREGQYGEIIFCEGNLSFNDIIVLLQQVPQGVYARFHADHSSSIIGSDSRDTAGESLSDEGYYSLADPYQQYMKRLTDIVIALFILVSFPIQLLITGSRIIPHALVVLSGRKTWMGYGVQNLQMPVFKKGLLTTNRKPVANISTISSKNTAQHESSFRTGLYWLRDIKLIVKHYRRAGKN
ncbi:glycosyltransferase family 2 protein [Segetibacter sp. 3557_3]|uniref:glycosyltransferase family 2 protein n=1 Tax=Segetibacter sp. 3557_3 TaxID=2547429 RepID=UPI00140541BA|nr:glycosyltransferase [Segetibacter sp. 3557_3]